MSASQSIPLGQYPVREKGGLVWNRLHSEREDICEALVREPTLNALVEPDRNATNAAAWHRELLQGRLKKVDKAMDRLNDGSYGSCVVCERWVQDSKLQFDPAVAYCIECWAHQQVQMGTGALSDPFARQWEADSSHGLSDGGSPSEGLAFDSLVAFDTIRVRTHNSDYRITLLDPKTGRSFVEGGSFFAEPVETMVSGSIVPHSSFRTGWLGAGFPLEMWADGKLIITSAVESFFVEHQYPTAAPAFSPAVK